MFNHDPLRVTAIAPTINPHHDGGGVRVRIISSLKFIVCVTISLSANSPPTHTLRTFALVVLILPLSLNLTSTETKREMRLTILVIILR